MQPKATTLRTTQFARHKEVISTWAAAIFDEETIFQSQIDLASVTQNLLDRFQQCGKPGLAIAKNVAEFAFRALESKDPRVAEDVIGWIEWLELKTDVDDEDEETPLSISILDIVALFVKIDAKRNSRSRLQPNFKGIDASVTDSSSHVTTDVAAGATLNRHRGAVINGDLPNTGGKALLAAVEENSRGCKWNIKGNVNDSMGARMGNGVPKLGRGASADSTDDEK